MKKSISVFTGIASLAGMFLLVSSQPAEAATPTEETMKQIQNHLGKWTAVVGNTTGWVKNLDQTDAARNSANQIQVKFGECGKPETWTNAVVTPGNAREIALQYLKPGTTYCYEAQAYRNGQSVGTKKTGQVTTPSSELLQRVQTGATKPVLGTNTTQPRNTTAAPTTIPTMSQIKQWITDAQGIRVQALGNSSMGLNIQSQCPNWKEADKAQYEYGKKTAAGCTYTDGGVVERHGLGGLRQTLVNFVEPGATYCVKGKLLRGNQVICEVNFEKTVPSKMGQGTGQSGNPWAGMQNNPWQGGQYNQEINP